MYLNIPDRDIGWKFKWGIFGTYRDCTKNHRKKGNKPKSFNRNKTHEGQGQNLKVYMQIGTHRNTCNLTHQGVAGLAFMKGIKISTAPG